MKKSCLMLWLGLAMVVAPLARAAEDFSRFDGRWQIDNQRSNWSDGKFPKGRMHLVLDLKFTPEQISYHSVNDTFNPAKPAHVDYQASLNGTPSPLAGSARYDTVQVRPLGDRELEILESKSGDVIVGAYWVFSKDGKHLMRWGIGKSPDGHSKAYQEFFDKL